MGGDWEANEQPVSQQYLPGDAVSSRADGMETASESDCGG